MKKYESIPIKTRTPYNVLIGHRLLECCASLLDFNFKTTTAVIITDDTVAGLYLEKVKKSFIDSGFNVLSHVLKHGEQSKSFENLNNILEFLAQNSVTRSDMLVALGGGVVGDITGFAAAIYLRGIKFIQIPTTLLAAVDSSVGGKTAVNLKSGKNLAGAFYQPSAVIYDCDTFNSLPRDIIADGLAESIKYGVICDSSLFNLLKSCSYETLNENLVQIVKRCVTIKSEIVSVDEFDTGTRQLLNLGHTFGHAIEKCSSFSITHGHAVACGMVLAANAAYKLGICDRQAFLDIKGIVSQYNLPTATNFSASKLYDAAIKDKKRTGQTINLILPEKIGSCIIYPIDLDKLKSLISAALEDNI